MPSSGFGALSSFSHLFWISDFGGMRGDYFQRIAFDKADEWIRIASLTR
jgi:hypothetical protein